MSSNERRLALAGFRAGPGGIGRDMVNLAGWFARAGVEVDLLLPPGEHPDLDRAGFSYRQICIRTGGDAPADLKAYLGDRRPAVVLCNRDRMSAHLVRLRQAGDPVRIAILVGTNVLEKLRQGSVLTRGHRRRRLIRVYSRADLLIGVSTGAGRALEELLQDHRCPPIHTIYNPLNLDAVHRLADAAAPHPWLEDKRLPVVISVGRLVEVKDQATLLGAFARLRAERPCRLILLGEGGQRDPLTALAIQMGINEDVDLPGFQQNPFAWVARSDLFVLTSRFEGLGNALVEALAVGIPVVSTDCPNGPREILQNGRYGRLVQVGDVEALAEAMSLTLDAPPPPSLLREAALRFDLDTIGHRYLTVLGLAPADEGGGNPVPGGNPMSVPA